MISTKIQLPEGARLPNHPLRPAGTVWVCPKCDWTYRTPVAAREVFHRCGRGLDARRVRLRPRPH